MNSAVRFVRIGDEFEDENNDDLELFSFVHCKNFHTPDYTLCSLASEGTTCAVSLEATTEKINCPTCLEIIKGCRDLDDSEF